MIGGVLAVKAIGVSDAYFIGQLGETDLAAISFTFPVVMTLVSLAIGLSSGASSVLSQSIGEESDSELRDRIIAGAILLAFLFSLFLAVAGALTVTPLFSLMGAEGQVLEKACRYMLIWYSGATLLIGPIVINGILRATGDGVAPAVLMSIVAAINIALNPVFIFGWFMIPGFGIQGAAIATLIARGMSLIAALFLLYRRNLITLDLDVWRKAISTWPEIIRIAVPAAGSTAMNPLAIAIGTAAIATLGQAQVAGFGVATKIQSIALVPLLALSAASAPFAGQNSGAGKTDRTGKMLQLCLWVSLGWAVAMAIVFWVFRQPLAAQFTESDAAQEATALYLLIVPLSFAGYGMVVATSAAFNGLGRSLTSFALAGGRALAILAPGTWIGVTLGGFAGAVMGIASANVLSGIAAWFLAIRHSLTTRKNGRTEDGSGKEEID